MSDGIKITRHRLLNGSVCCIQHTKNGVPHRIDGPSEIRYRRDGTLDTETYHREGHLHRLDGPAWIWYNDIDESIRTVRFWLEGEELCFWDFYDKVSEENQKALLKNWLPYNHV
jgi:hypothetical protein